MATGSTPAEIATEIGISLSVVCGYLDTAISLRLLRRSSVYFAVPDEVRDAVDQFGELTSPRANPPDYVAEALSARFGRGDVYVAARYGPADRHYTDLFDLLTAWEQDFHELCREVLTSRFGADEEPWLGALSKWQREAFASQTSQVPPSEMTTVTSLKKIVHKHWSLLEPGFSDNTRDAVEAEIEGLTALRNRTMHPVRWGTDRLTEADVRAVDMALNRLALARKTLLTRDRV